jgi:hypothetical protein
MAIFFHPLNNIIVKSKLFHKAKIRQKHSKFYVLSFLSVDGEIPFNLEYLKQVTGHGIPMTGELLLDSLQKLSKEFDRISVPTFGRCVDDNLHMKDSSKHFRSILGAFLVSSDLGKGKNISN